MGVCGFGWGGTRADSFKGRAATIQVHATSMLTPASMLTRTLLDNAEEKGRRLPPVPGLRTLLEKANLLARYPEAARCCVELGITQIDDLEIDAVREELSRILRLKFVEKEKLKAECADVAKLRAYASSASDRPESNNLDQSSSAQERGSMQDSQAGPASTTSTDTRDKRQRRDGTHSASDERRSHTLFLAPPRADEPATAALYSCGILVNHTG
jgi:hypothetical protein